MQVHKPTHISMHVHTHKCMGTPCVLLPFGITITHSSPEIEVLGNLRFLSRTHLILSSLLCTAVLWKELDNTVIYLLTDIVPSPMQGWWFMCLHASVPHAWHIDHVWKRILVSWSFVFLQNGIFHRRNTFSCLWKWRSSKNEMLASLVFSYPVGHLVSNHAEDIQASFV